MFKLRFMSFLSEYGICAGGRPMTVKVRPIFNIKRVGLDKPPNLYPLKKKKKKKIDIFFFLLFYK